MTPAGIEPATFRFVAQHLNHCATAVPNERRWEMHISADPDVVMLSGTREFLGFFGLDVGEMYGCDFSGMWLLITED